MPLLDLQIRMRELGRIRTGQQVASAKGKRPSKLEHYRLTSASKPLLDAAAALWGGTVRPWASPAGEQYELLTEADSLPVVIPPGQALSQWYELWSGGGCQRRCDGETELISGGACLCPADPIEKREAAAESLACKPTTRLNVILPDLPDLGVWRLESHGYYAAVELAGAERFLAIASGRGLNVPATLRLEQRQRKIAGKAPARYAVPIIEFTATRVADLLAAQDAPALPPGPTRPDRYTRVPRPEMPPAPALPAEAAAFRQRERIAGWEVEEAEAPTATAMDPAKSGPRHGEEDRGTGRAPAAEAKRARRPGRSAPTAPEPPESQQPPATEAPTSAPVEAPAEAVADAGAAASGNGTGSLTRDQFHELLKAHDVPVGNVLMAAEEIYGRKFGFDDEERAVLWDALRPA